MNSRRIQLEVVDRPVHAGEVMAQSEHAPPELTSREDFRQLDRWLTYMGSQLRQAYLESTRALVAAVEAKDAVTEQHSARVRRFSREIALRMGLGQKNIRSLETAAILHDIGKIGIPDAILNKPGPLTPAEFEVVRQHPTIATEILGHTTYLQKELPAILHHHERYDGTGYPHGLAREKIPVAARILAVADALDAMLSRRTYKKPLSVKAAKMELVRCRGQQFDPQVVDAALEWLSTESEEEIRAIPELSCGAMDSPGM